LDRQAIPPGSAIDLSIADCTADHLALLGNLKYRVARVLTRDGATVTDAQVIFVPQKLLMAQPQEGPQSAEDAHRERVIRELEEAAKEQRATPADQAALRLVGLNGPAKSADTHGGGGKR